MTWGALTHAGGLAPDLWSRGWLPRHRAAEALGMTLADLDRAARDGTIKTRNVGPHAKLYQVRQ